MITRPWRRSRADEGGFAMITALLVTVVAGLLGVTAMQLAMHNDSSSGADRARTLAVHAAEAGVEVSLQKVETTGTSLLPCTLSGTANARGGASWSATLTYYAAYPMTGTPMTCTNGTTLGTTTPPAGVRIVSTGNVGVTGGTKVRVMETQARLAPVLGLFDKALYSIQSPDITNNLTIWGHVGNDANFFTSGNWVCGNTFDIAGSIYVQGTLQMGNTCRVAVDAWSTGDISMYNSAYIGHDAISSQGSLLVSTVGSGLAVGNDAVLGGACTGCTGKVGGVVTTNKVQAPPPTADFPSINFTADDALAWQAAGWGIEYFTNCDSAINWMTQPKTATENHQTEKRVLRITGGCTMSFTNNTTITRSAPLAIITDGNIVGRNKTTFKSGDGDWHDMLFIVETGTDCDLNDDGVRDNGEINFSNLTTFQKVKFFVYSPCDVSVANGDSNARGQLYGDKVSIQNQLSYTYSPTMIPGSGAVVGYDIYVDLVREILP